MCDGTIRKWRRFGTDACLLDLKNAYLQLHVDPELWKYQVVRHNHKNYYLTRLGFGLNCAPRIMSVILKKILGLDDAIRRNTDNYIDDIIVNTSAVSVEYVADHLARYGLKTKPPQPLAFDKVLGLQIDKIGTRQDDKIESK